ncbi:MAG: hypothetical protein KatS3mg031_0319 [Chitinophagales bacterium]|nr:MAG: hypothetical protein KatS3mg031_0319 [Chitinophagales bacterium]
MIRKKQFYPLQCLVLCLVWLSGGAVSEAYAQNDWTLAKDKDGVKVYTRKLENSDLKASKAVVFIHSDIKKVFDMLTDADHHNQWMDRVKASRLLKKISDNEFYVYYEAEAPWPVNNRDVVARFRIEKAEDGKVKIVSVGEPTYLPPKDGVVRVPDTQSVWELIQVDENLVEVTFISHVDPGGSVPEWISNLTVTDNPLNTLKNLKLLLEKK